jgi:uncharacterized membrane protein YhaH (DUF805 family)
MQINTATLDLPTLLFSPRGRIPRKPFLCITVLFNLVGWALYIAATLTYQISQPLAALFAGILTFLTPLFFYSYSVQLIKRMHDINQPALLATPALVYLGLFYLFGNDPIPLMNRLLPFEFNITLLCLSVLRGLPIILIGALTKGHSGPNKYGPDTLAMLPTPTP